MSEASEAPPLVPTCTVQGKPCTEYGREHLKFSCPKCHVPWALSGEGQHLCHCGALVQVTKPAVPK